MFNRKKIEDLTNYVFYLEEKIDKLSEYLVIEYCDECGEIIDNKE
jgi:hypothetical protein